MNARETAVVVIASFGTVLVLVRFGAIWRGAGDRAAPPSWPFSHAMWRGVVRTYPLGALMFPSLLVNYVIAKLDSSPSPGLVAVQAAAVAIAVVAFALYVSVVLYNRPKRIVAPPYRDEPGVLEKRGGGGGSTR
ncbi:MAG TPA: hypothetical protein VF517_10480 [Thermoleophilaceae bacterium]|jgi:hypothetical protein